MNHSTLTPADRLLVIRQLATATVGQVAQGVRVDVLDLVRDIDAAMDGDTGKVFNLASDVVPGWARPEWMRRYAPPNTYTDAVIGDVEVPAVTS